MFEAFTVILLTVFSLLNHGNSAEARDWYVRPTGGVYGAEDGSSYENAWDGLLATKWGEGGVGPGDNLYVCGLNVHEMTNKGYVATQADIPIVSGRSETERVTIRGDCPGDPGIVWGAYRMSYEPWQDEGDGVWSITLPGNSYPDWYFQDVGVPSPESHVVLDKVASLDELRARPGSHYSPKYVGGSRLYVHCTDGGRPDGRLYGNRWGYDFVLGNAQYATFRDLTFWSVYKLAKQTERLSHVRWENCRMAYGEHSLVGVWGHSEGVEVIGCDLSWASNAIYTIRHADDGDVTSNRYVFRGNRIHDIGVRTINQNSDAHSIGIQGGIGGVIEDNEIWNCGTGPLLYAFTNQELRDTVVRRNFVRDLHTLGSATGYGVSTMCNNDSLSEKGGNQFYQNIVVRAPVGYRFQFQSLQEVYNNIAADCNVGLESSRNFEGIGAKVKLRNNVFVGSNTYHVRWYSGATDFLVDSDHNLFYPSVGQPFNLRGRNLTYREWLAAKLTYPDSSFDPHSITGQPKFLNAGSWSTKADFRPSFDSPVVDAGTAVGLTTDIEGQPIDVLSDIGAYEYPEHPSPPKNLGKK